MAFCLPFSTALTLIFSAFGTLFGLVGFDWEAFKKVMRHPIAILCVALFGWLALSMLWSIAPTDEMIEGISKYRKLLYVPLVGMLLITTRVKPWFLMNFFVAGCLVVCVGSLFSSTGLAELVLGPQNGGGGGWLLGGASDKAWFFIGPPTNPTFGRAHIAQGAFLACSSVYVFGIILDATVGKGRLLLKDNKIIKHIVLLFILVYVTLNLRGMTGFVLLSIGTFLYCCLLASRLGTRKAAFLISFIVIFIGCNIYFSKNLQERIFKSVKDTTDFIQNQKSTSEGQRLTYWRYGLVRASERPLSGWGVGSFAELYSDPANLTNISKKSRPHPHSEYVLQYVQGGAMGLLMFTLILILILRDLLKEKNKSFHISSLLLVGLLLMIDGIGNSIIWDAGEGHFAVLILVTIIVTKCTSTVKNN